MSIRAQIARDEERREGRKAIQCVVHDEFVREFGDGNHEHQVEEELEPGGVALLLNVGECRRRGGRSQGWADRESRPKRSID